MDSAGAAPLFIANYPSKTKDFPPSTPNILAPQPVCQVIAQAALHPVISATGNDVIITRTAIHHVGITTHGGICTVSHLVAGVFVNAPQRTLGNDEFARRCAPAVLALLRWLT